MGEALFVQIGDGEKREIGRETAIEFLGCTDGGELSATVARVGPGMETVPPHYHRNHDEAIFVLGGELEMRLGERTVSARAGGLALIPAGVVHAFRNAGSEPATFLELYSPGGFERFLRDLADGLNWERPADPALLEEIAARHDVVRV